MKKAEDFRKAFGPVTPGFESAAKETIRELRAKETQKKRRTAGEWLRYRRPVLAMAMALVLFIGFLAVNDTLNLSGHTDEIRTGKAQYTVQPIETALAQGIEEGEGEGEGEGLADGAGIAADETAGQIEHTFWGFMTGWAEKDTDRMLALCADEWKANTPDAAQAIENLAASGKPRGYEITGVSGKDGDPVRTAGVVVQREDEAGAFTYTRYEIAFREENWNGFTVYQVDPDGFTAGEPAEPVAEENLVLLTKEGIIRTDMEMHNAGIRYDDLIPLNLSVEKQGIRVDLVSGCVKGNETYFLYKIHDVDGKYTDYDLSFSSPWSEDSTSWEMMHLYDDREANEYIKLIHMGLSDLVPKAGGSLKVGIDQISLEDGSGFIDLLPLLKEHGGTEKGTALPMLERNYRNTELPKDLKVLNYKKPLDIPLYRDACLGGLGWIDGQLHVQLHNTGRDVIDLRNGRASACSMDVTCSVTGKSYEEIINDYGPLRWDGDNDGWPEWSEFVYNCQPEDAEKMELSAYITVTDRILEDDWTFDIQLDPVRIPDDGTAAVKEMAAADPAVPNTGLAQKMRNDINQLELWQFFGNWAQGNVDDMVSALNLTHKLHGEASKARVKELLESGTPLNYQINGIRPEGEEKVYTCTVKLASGSGESSRCERFEVRINTDVMSDWFGIDLNSFDNGQPAEMDPAKEIISLSRETYIHDHLEYFHPGISGNLRPIGLTCERNGIRMELISGLLKDGEEYIFYSLEDVEGKYDLGSLDVSDLSDSIGKWETCSSSPVYRDRAARKAYFMWNPHYGNQPVDLTDRNVSLRLDYLDFLQNCWVNIAELAEQYGRTTEGVPAPEEVSEWDVQKGTFVTPEGAKVLDYRNPLDIQVLPNTKITGIGWIDDRLHVQFCVKNMTRASFYFNIVQRSELSWYDADNHGSYTEVIFDIGPGDEKIKEMYFCPNIGQEQIFGPWRIEFPLSAICPETAEQAPQANADDAVRPVEELFEDYGNINLAEREGKLVFDVRANTKVYTQDEIGYALRDDGTAEAMPTSVYPGHREHFRIPEKVNGHVVTAIGEEALWGFDVKSITLPDTVKSIGRHAFSSCDKLETIRIPEGVTSIENSVFMDCISLKDVTIPSSVTAIGNRAFSGCLSLTGISIPSATVSLGDYAFVGCTGLTSVTLPEGLNTLGCYALYRCTGLETVEVPGGVSLVGNGAFKNCTGLQTARLQEGVTFLGADAFTGCGALETIELPESLRSVGERAFMGCASLKKLALPEGLESIGRAAFAGCTGLETLEIPESVTSIGENAFKGCENLTCTVTAGSYAMLYCVNNGITCIVK